MARSLLFLQFILVLSGIAGLGYQLVWVRQFSVGLGHEMPSMLAVVAGFFAGLALGAWWLDDRIKRSQKPARWYVGLELLIGGWALLSIPLIHWLVNAAPAWMGIEPTAWLHWPLAFAIPLIALLPATVAMGATLPAIEQLATRSMSRTRIVGGLYAANTAGAVIGTLATTYWGMPLLGHSKTVQVLAGVNIFAALLVAATHWNSSAKVQQEVNAGTEQISLPISKNHLTLLLVMTGFLGIGYEVLAVRVMAQILEGTVYSFAAMLSVYLIGTSLGAALYQRFVKNSDFNTVLSRLLVGLTITALVGIFALYQSPSLYQNARLSLGDSLGSVLLSEGIVALMVFALPSMFMGATFSHLLQAARNRTGSLGRALALNTLGGALAPGLIGVLWLVSVGAKWALGTIIIAYALLVPSRSYQRWMLIAIPLLLLVSLSGENHLLKLRKGESVLSYREGVMASVAVVERNGSRNLRVNNRYQMGGTSTEAVLIQRPQTHIPLLLHPQPQSALFLGVASGVTTGAATLHPGLEVDAVELVPESLSMLTWFANANRSLHKNDNVNLYSADARRFVRSTDKSYDVIIADLFQPGRDGAGLLYTQEHFTEVSKRLKADGLFAQWLPFYQLDEYSIRIIIATFNNVFPYSTAFLANNNLRYPAVALIGSMKPLYFTEDYFTQRVQNPALQKELNQLLLGDAMRLFGQQVFDHEQLASLVEGVPLNTDDHPRILYEAPRFTYRRDALPFGRLMPLIKRLGVPENTLMSSEDSRMENYLIARNSYLNAMSIHMIEGVDAAIEKYKQSSILSKDFTSGYAQVVKIALAKIKDQSVTQGRELLEWLHEQRPDVPAAKRLLDRLDQNN